MVASPPASSCRGAVLVPGRRMLHQIHAFTLDCSQALLRSSPVHLHIPVAARPAENLPSWEMPSRGHVPGTALHPFFRRCPAGQDRQRCPPWRRGQGRGYSTVQRVAGAAALTAALSEVDVSVCLKNLIKKGFKCFWGLFVCCVFFLSQGCSAATAHPSLGWAMLSCWVQALHCAGDKLSAWVGMKGPQVPSAKKLNEPLMNDFFFPFLLSLTPTPSSGLMELGL